MTLPLENISGKSILREQPDRCRIPWKRLYYQIFIMLTEQPKIKESLFPQASVALFKVMQYLQRRSYLLGPSVMITLNL